MQPRIDRYLYCPFQIQMCDLQGGMGLGTAFLYEYQDETFIITNWHNMTGKHPVTGESLDSMRIPLFIKAKWIRYDPHRQMWHLALTSHTTIQIEDDAGWTLWYEHPTLGSFCDVVAIPFERPADWPEIMQIPANRIDQGSIPVVPGLKVMVVGYPRGMSTGPGLPLMKTGFLSSMPGYEIRLNAEFSDVGGMKGGYSIGKAMFLDVHTVEGMSGAPVFGEHSGIWNPNDPFSTTPMQPSDQIGTGRMFLGCHSSRLWRQDERGGLGICYPSSMIDEICNAKQKGSRFPQS